MSSSLHRWEIVQWLFLLCPTKTSSHIIGWAPWFLSATAFIHVLFSWISQQVFLFSVQSTLFQRHELHFFWVKCEVEDVICHLCLQTSEESYICESTVCLRRLKNLLVWRESWNLLYFPFKWNIATALENNHYYWKSMNVKEWRIHDAGWTMSKD